MIFFTEVALPWIIRHIGIVGLSSYKEYWYINQEITRLSIYNIFYVSFFSSFAIGFADCFQNILDDFEV